MTIIKTIEVLRLEFKTTNPDLDQDLRDALTVAISALRRIDRLRALAHYLANPLLESETLE